jgi:hypothetical protein
MTSRIIALATVLFAVVACRDVTQSIDPTTDVTEDTVTVFPLRGSPLAAPSALDLFTPRTLRVGEVSWTVAPYDVVVDTASGAAVVHPSQFITTEAPNTGMLEVTTPFDSIPEAPTAGYQDSAAVSLTPGETIIVRGRNVCANGFPGRDVFYAKVQFLELASSGGFSAARFRIRTNPNCGFRSFADGLPAF